MIKFTQKVVFVLVLLVYAVSANAQQITVTGTVTDSESGMTIPGVNIVELSTRNSAKVNGTATDIDGNYSISVPADASLSFSYLGFASQTIQVNGQAKIDLVLKPDLSNLEEVVVVGYGQVKKKDLTGSVSKVDGKDLENLPTARIDQTLQGRAAGVQVSQISGEPGSAPTIRIRGGNSIQGNNEPLWVIDGVIVGTDFNLSNLNSNDILSIDILKDAVAVSIYGTRGANGVILVTTKSGKGTKGGTNVSFNSYYGVQSMVTKVDFLDGPQHADYANEDAEFRNSALPFTDLDAVANVDWIDQVSQNSAVYNVDVSLSGMSENQKVNYYISGNYFDQEGLIRETGIKKYIFRANMDNEISDLVKVGFRINLSRLKTENSKINFGTLYLSTTPTRGIYDENGEFTALDPITDGVSRNFEADIQMRQNHSYTTNILGNIYVELQPMDNLTFKTTFSPEINNFKQNVFNPGALPNNLLLQNGGDAAITSTMRVGWINENTVNYIRDFDNGSQLSALAGFTIQKSEEEGDISRAFRISNDVTGFNNLGFGSDPTRNEVASSYDAFQLVSWLARVNYSFHDKYLFTVVGRVDGSSRFAPENKYALFPSGAFAWKLHEEPFIQNLNLFSDLKLRTSYGLSGSQAIPSYRTLAVLSSANTTFNGIEQPGVILGRPENPELKWETTQQLDIGLEMGFLNGRLSVEFDFYQKNTRDLLLNAQLPRQTGFVSKLQNIGKVQNRGFEFLVNSTNLNKDKFTWSTSFSLSHNNNKVVDLGGVDFINLATPAQQGGTGARLIVGETTPVFTGVRYLGTWKSQEEIDEAGLGGDHDVGGPRFEDTNGDNQITEDDFIVLGSPQPDFYYGFGNSMRMGNFTLDFFFQGTYGNEVFNSLTQTAFFGRSETTKYAETLNRWTPENPTSDIPRAGSVAALSEIYNNSEMIEDGSHIRLKNFRFGYNVPLKTDKIRGLSVYLTGNNLFVISSFRLKDPETSQYGRQSDNLSMGFSSGQYPTSRTVAIGAKIDF